MDDIDRPGDQPRSKSPKMQKCNERPPVAMDESQELDEVDRPSTNITSSSSDQNSEEFDSVDRPSTVPMETVSRDASMEEILPSINVVYDNKPVNNKTADTVAAADEKAGVEKQEEEEEMLPTINSAFENSGEYVVVDTPTKEIEITDAPPNGAPVNTASNITDGPFSGFFTAKQHQPIQHRSERRDKEGIVTKHTTYHPRPLDKSAKGWGRGDQMDGAVQSDSYYDMSHFPRGKLTLINVKHFKRSSGMADYPREGTDRDAEGLTNLFLDLGFVVERFDNPSKSEITAIVKAAANEDYSSKSCCACAILSHGEEGIVYGTDDFVKIKDITRLFRTRSLAGKPKFFLFQACQGSEYMNPLDSVDGPAKPRSEQEMALTLPAEADFLYAYSTVPGYYSWRNSRRGSWFMEALVQIFRQNAHKMDVMRMLVRVNDVIAYRKSRTDDYKTDNKRQIASLVTQMRKDFFLFPPYGPLPS